MIFYVEAKVHRMKYEDKDWVIDYRGLIDAATVEDAEIKFRKYWDIKSDTDGVYYTVLECLVNETIS